LPTYLEKWARWWLGCIFQVSCQLSPVLLASPLMLLRGRKLLLTWNLLCTLRISSQVYPNPVWGGSLPLECSSDCKVDGMSVLLTLTQE
jgi:hypothetical protein